LVEASFLFMLYFHKINSCYIFDEADTILDDTNIEKLNCIINKFSIHLQLAIITHNKAAVDVSYGVHMPEQGVSEV
jgi:chromosome segregation ATPase